MDSTFWGPSGWRLLHLITFAYNPELQKESVRKLFTNLPYVLPCKFCRQHLAGHMETHPLSDTVLKDAEGLSKWLWTIHNEVNDMVGKKDPNPSFEAVERIYKERIRQGCSRVEFEGWDFLFSVAEHHPFTQAQKHPHPLKGAPARAKRALTRNKWNLMTGRERFPFYKKFWEAVGDSLPFAEWRDAWNSCNLRASAMRARGDLKHELWRLRTCMERKLDLENRETFERVCKKLEEHCASAPRGRKITRKLCKRN